MYGDPGDGLLLDLPHLQWSNLINQFMIWVDMKGSNQMFGYIYIYIWYDHVWIWTIRLTAHVHQMLLGQQMGRLPISSGTQEIRKWIQVTRLNYPDQMTSNYYPLTKQCCDGPSQCWTMLNMFDLLLCMADFHLQNAPKNSLHGTRPSLCWTLRTQRLEFAHNTAE